VDDRPENNLSGRQLLEMMGFRVTLARSTQDALAEIKSSTFAAIISDMGRREGPREGYVLLDTLRAAGDQTPYFIHAGSRAPEHQRETAKHGGQGTTNDVGELVRMVVAASAR
jgi:CheY-like chemotaxis protein